MLVEADTAEDAFDLVEGILSEAPEWSDWHEASGSHSKDFAGRWSNSVFITHKDEEAKSENYLCYATDPALAEVVIERFLQNRLDDIRSYKAKAIDLSSAPYDPYAKDTGMDIWYSKKLAQLLNDEWTPDSGLYDLTTYTASLAYFIERVKNAPEKQWLIPVDFHF
jgi:hypothetical protein